MSNYSQSLIDDYKQTIERLQKECTEKTDWICELLKENESLKEKLKIAEEHLDVIARGYHFGDDIEKHLKLLAEQALQKDERG